jgi:beta-lactamase superfamily II metal-dependent hydrolase
MSGVEHVRIRMYDVGFGDCFLLGFPADDREHLVLVDCGVHSASKGGHPLPDVIADVKRTAGKASGQASGKARLDVIAMSHRHRDHVEGFRDDSVWADVEVGEVWMPWTEHPEDPAARRIKDRQSKRSLQLQEMQEQALAAQAAAPKKKQADWSPVKAIAENNYTNAKAMTTLHRGFAGKPRRYFLPEPSEGPYAGTRVQSFSTEVLPGVRIHVLGPSRDEDTIRDMDPPGDESYFRLGDDDMSLGAEGGPLPFERWAIEQRAFRAQFQHLDTSSLGTIVNAGHTSALSLAVALEQAVNGTSLVLLFECGDATILMSGDAQWGTWRRLLADHATRDLATKSRVLKVGHHGSHNATPRRFVKGVMELTDRPDAAFVSVAATSIPSWSDIPREPLLTDLGKTWGRVIRSDRPAEIGGTAVPSALPVEVGPGGLWIELQVPTRRV